MRYCIVIMFILLALLSTALSWMTSPWATKSTKVVDCGVGKSVFTIDALSLDPAQPVPGENVSLYLDYSVPAGVTVNDGEARYAVTYNFLPLTPTVEPLCKNIPCPLSSGSYSNVTYMQWPSSLSGSLVTKIMWFDGNGVLLLCIQLSTTLQKVTPSS